MSKQYSYIGKYSDGGSVNSFYKLKGKKYGFKSFPNKSLASFSHTVQSDLSRANLTPRVYSPVCKIRIPNYFAQGDGKSGIRIVTHMVLSDWGYLTEIAKPYICNDPDCCDCSSDSECENYYIINDLINNLDRWGIEYNDAHAGNFGYVKRRGTNKLVVIDLGRESIGSTDNNYPEVCWDGVEDRYCGCENCAGKYDYA